MLGAGINIVPFVIQRHVPGIGPYVLPAVLLGAVPAVLAAMAYAILASAMPRAGGSYVYASRALNPYLGFVASFSQWFGLSIAIGLVAYVVIPFLRDIAAALGKTWDPAKFDVDDFGMAFIRFEGGADLILRASWAAHIEKNHFGNLILGTEGGITTEPPAL